MNSKVGGKKTAQNHMSTQFFPAEKEDKELWGHSPRGPTPLSVDILGVCPHTPSLGMERWTIPRYGAQGLRGKTLHRLLSPTPQTLFSWPLAELHPAGAGPYGPRDKLPTVQVTKEAWVQCGM